MNIDLQKLTPWLLIATLGVLGIMALRSANTNPNTPPPNFNPWLPAPGPVVPGPNPNHPNPCPDCYPRWNPYTNTWTPPASCGCERCNKMERAFNAERSAVRRELARTQLNLQQVQGRVGVEKMRMPDWLFYQYSSSGSAVPGSPGSLKWDAVPTPNPDGDEVIVELKPKGWTSESPPESPTTPNKAHAVP